MSVLGLFAVSCDRCGEQSAPATDLSSVRVIASTAGWALVRDSGRVFDYCPDHNGSVRPVAAVVEPTPAARWVCPECGQGKHRNCNGWAWDFDKDEKTQCQCPEVHS